MQALKVQRRQAFGSYEESLRVWEPTSGFRVYLVLTNTCSTSSRQHPGSKSSVNAANSNGTLAAHNAANEGLGFRG